MARKIRSPSLENRSNRLKLAIRKKFYATRISLGIRLCYRRCKGPGTWTVLAASGWSRRFGLADDYEDANGATVLSYDQATALALKLARGEDAGAESGDKPITIGEAVDSYGRELKATGRRIDNATRVSYHLAPSLAAKPAALFTERDMRAFRDLLIEKKLRPGSVVRTLKSLSAALTFATKGDPRISNKLAWKVEQLRDANVARGPLWVLNENQVARAVTQAYALSYRFGIFCEVLATFGVRPSQARRLLVGDLEAEHGRLQMPSSMKGSGRLYVTHEPLPIAPKFAKRLVAEAAGRDANEPLLRDDAGNAWAEYSHERRWEAVATAAELPAGKRKFVGIYSLRHSSIARSLLRGLPIALVSKMHDVSEKEIRRHYGKYITHMDTAHDMMRAAQVSFDAPARPDAKVVPLARRKR